MLFCWGDLNTLSMSEASKSIIGLQRRSPWMRKKSQNPGDAEGKVLWTRKLESSALVHGLLGKGRRKFCTDMFQNLPVSISLLEVEASRQPDLSLCSITGNPQVPYLGEGWTDQSDGQSAKSQKLNSVQIMSTSLHTGLVSSPDDLKRRGTLSHFPWIQY